MTTAFQGRAETMDSTESWRTLFENWPDAIERKGTMVSKFGEVVPFVNFLISGSLVLLERSMPDTSGSRKAIMAYESIAVVKLNSAAPLPKFQTMGFQQPI